MNERGNPLPKGIPERLIKLGFLETPTHYKIPLQHLTQKNWESILPIAV